MSLLLWVLACGTTTGGGTASGSGGAPNDGGNPSTGGAAPAGSGGRAGAAPEAGAGSAGATKDAGTSEVAPPEPGVTVLQEDELGFCAVDGKVLPREGSTTITGFSGPGFADGDPGIGASISWSVKADASGKYAFIWRYAFGGLEANLRDARLLVNGVVVAESVAFAYTNTWNDWQETPPLSIDLAAGANFIRMEALYPSGLANLDYLKILGEGIRPDTPHFSLKVSAHPPAGGTVGHLPVQNDYAYRTDITLSATVNPGYFFQSFSGDVSSAKPTFTFAIEKNTDVAALFLPVGTAQDPNLVGYAAVQDDAGTPYIVTGGSLGPTVTVSTLEDLKKYLASPDPYVVVFDRLFEGAEAVPIASNKTLLGVGTSAHLQGIGLSVNGSRNVIIRNIAVSHVVAEGASDANDAIEITGGARNIWIDHCELYSDLTHDKDYYDGLVEIKNEASFITVSWCVIHDHYKASLISSGDGQIADTVIRTTYHHNYFHNCGSRLPSIRFGRAHVFNNYYKDNTSGSCINSRMGAVVKAEGNYFENSKDAIGSWDSPMVGSWDVSDNVFDRCTGAQPATSTGSLAPPYAYTPVMATDVRAIVVAGAGLGKL
ncbi:MAG TPA: CBM35 domain-containing protein [Polyangiaceae bacterium]|nr:CBM35 domain-containing protein [Polyangiaceae bacterium]